MARRPQDARAPYYYGNLLYDKRRYEDAIGAWRRAARLDPTFRRRTATSAWPSSTC